LAVRNYKKPISNAELGIKLIGLFFKKTERSDTINIHYLILNFQ
jgi:hypothetical protein